MSFFNNLSNLFGSAKRTGSPSGDKTSNLKPKFKFPVTSPAPLSPKPTPSLLTPAVTPPKKLSEDIVKITETAIREAQARAREIVVEAKDEAMAIREKAEQEARALRKALEDQQRSLDQKLDKIESRLEQMDERETRNNDVKNQLLESKNKLELEKEKIVTELERASGMTRDEAKAFILEEIERKVTKEAASLIRQKEEETKNELDERIREMLTDAMVHGANDYVVEYTVSTVELGTPEDKGRIIGKGGRNIHEFELRTGVDVDLDFSPTQVRLSCFDPVRREIAKISLQRLVKDGRIQPSRIEEVIKKVTSEIDKIIFEEGKKLCHAVGIYNMPTELIAVLGRFKYRFSYGQNMIAHTLEETKIGVKLAQELKADVNIVKMGCLLHDIGKVLMDEEGSHIELGVKIAKKYGIPQAIVDCIAQHHEDEPFSRVESMIVYIADAISGARPGARYDNYDEYVQRLGKLETISKEYPEVAEAYAIQAGREIRVILIPEKSKDDDVTMLSVKIRDRIKNEVTYPGTVTVTVIRETRSQSIAK